MKSPYKNWTMEQVKKVKNDEIPEGKTYAQCYYFCRVHLNRAFKPIKGKVVENRDIRGKKYHDMHESGMSYTEIAKVAGVSRQRVHSTVKQWLDSISK